MKRHYYFKEGFLGIIGILIFFAVTAYGAEESITLTTYYPSPYGVYSEMRLYPKNNPTTCDGTQRGLMYYDATDNKLKICNGTPPYQDIGGGYWAASPSNSANIYNTNLGNVGIGTNNPTGYGPGKSLHIFDSSNTNSGIRMQAGSADVGIGTAASLNGMILGAMSNGPIQFLTNSSERMRIANNGNVGIGTAIPAATERLHVVGNIYTPNSIKAGNLAVINSAFSAWNANGMLGMGYDNGFVVGIGQNAGGETGLGISSPGPTPSGAFYVNPTVNELRLKAYFGRSYNFLTSTGVVPDISRLFIRNNDGFVGIGTTNPQETLHVNGDIFAAGNFFKSGNLWAVNTAISAWGTEGGIIAGFNNGRTIGLGQTGAGAYTGLGITSGSSLLASFYAGNEVGIGTYLSGPPLVRMWAEQAPGFAGADIMVQKNGNIIMRTQQQDRLVINSAGNVGIGTTNPGGRLDVFYPSNRRFILQNDGNAVIYNTSTGAALWSSGTWASSIRWKENVCPLEKALDKVLRIRGVYFDWKEGYSNPLTGGKKGLGFIAEEVGKVFPEIVSYDKDGSGNAAALDYDKLTAALVEAIKEQQKQIEEQRQLIQHLQLEVNTLNTIVGKGADDA